ncbi:hypothetical protein J2R95_003208 [Bradyrhizobium japonicum]|uniref:hypothetical protein n=1 Tax=Bradyrhizobium japonicum TaxID=375 RepID=UPI00209EA9BB|nr:hypothetical protein [Bradyrhizobium japonicum]MCP1937413.1 hypothetical protein [Bradyrhizobium japonicum]
MTALRQATQALLAAILLQQYDAARVLLQRVDAELAEAKRKQMDAQEEPHGIR